MDLDAVLRELRESDRSRMIVLRPDGPIRAGTVGLLAGSFDPPTVGHLALVEAARGRCDLVVLVYSARTLPKESGAPEPLLAGGDRLAALSALVGERPWLGMALASHGLLADQAEAAGDAFAGSEIATIVGSDKLLQLLDPSWYGDRDEALTRLFARSLVLYGIRAGEETAVERALARPENVRWLDRLGRLPVSPETAAVSSRLVRTELAAGRDVGALVPPEVLPFLGVK